LKSSKRRQLLRGASMLAAGGVAAYAMPGSASAQARSPFSVSPTFIPIAGGNDLFPVRRIYCIGRNYAAHAREMGSDPTREPPFFFQKPTDAVQNVPIGATIDHPYPPLTRNYHYEIELVAAINKGGRNIAIDRALEHVRLHGGPRHDAPRPAARDGRRKKAVGDRQELRSLGAARPAAAGRGAIWLKVNGQLKQNADLSQMIWSVAEQVSKLSEAFELAPGDIIYSGTPENVGPVVKGDVMEGHIDALPNISVKVV